MEIDIDKYRVGGYASAWVSYSPEILSVDLGENYGSVTVHTVRPATRTKASLPRRVVFVAKGVAHAKYKKEDENPAGLTPKAAVAAYKRFVEKMKGFGPPRPGLLLVAQPDAKIWNHQDGRLFLGLAVFRVTVTERVGACVISVRRGAYRPLRSGEVLSTYATVAERAADFANMRILATSSSHELAKRLMTVVGNRPLQKAPEPPPVVDEGQVEST